ncbi:MAG: NAD(P)-dependent oxidoreductase [Thermomicrobiales bacterium]|nr:NAD(P)-dependent oxidoreductase [Thermomicrobiales bacterium]
MMHVPGEPGGANDGSSASRPRPILLTGAAGRIGAAFRLAHGREYRFRLADLDTGSLAGTPGEGHEVLHLDVADAAACHAACAGIDTIVHLAADPRPDAPWDSLLANNIQGAVNICEAALAAGCQRVVFASSAHAVGAYPPDLELADDAAPRPGNLYGASKAFGEGVLSACAVRGLSGVAIRIGAYDAPWYYEDTDANVAAAYISPRDMNQLLLRAIETPGISYAVVAGISRNRRRRFDLRLTHALLGYTPQDDGFQAREEHAARAGAG